MSSGACRPNRHVRMQRATLFDKLFNFLKSVYIDFIPFWKWEVPIAGKKKGKYQYKHIISICRSSQYYLAIMSVLLAVCLDRPRYEFFSSAFRNGLPLFLLDISVYIILGYFLGLKRFPVNYISLVIIKIFLVLEENKFKPGPAQLLNIQAKTLGRSGKNGEWTVVTASPKTVNVPGESTILKNAGIITMILLGFWIIHTFTQIRLNKYKETLLIAQTVASSWAAILFVSTWLFDEVPEIKRFHLKLCELWILFGVQTLAFVLAFLFERLLLSFGGRWKNFNTRVEWEGYIFILIFAITIRCIPSIHKGVYVSDVVSHKSVRLMKSLTPSSLMTALNASSTYFGSTYHKIEQIYIGF